MPACKSILKPISLGYKLEVIAVVEIVSDKDESDKVGKELVALIEPVGLENKGSFHEAHILRFCFYCVRGFL